MFYYKIVGYIFLSAVIAAATACGSSSAKPDAGLAGAANPSSSSFNLRVRGGLMQRASRTCRPVRLRTSPKLRNRRQRPPRAWNS